MKPEEIDIELAKPVTWRNSPHTVGDALTLAFDNDWRLRKQVLDGSPGMEVTCSMTFTLTVPREVALAHLERLLRVEQQQRERSQ